jgi:hypothetical protein
MGAWVGIEDLSEACSIDEREFYLCDQGVGLLAQGEFEGRGSVCGRARTQASPLAGVCNGVGTFAIAIGN